MAWLGDNIIEIGEPIVAGGAVDRFVQRFGSHMSSIAVQVADIDATVDVPRRPRRAGRVADRRAHRVHPPRRHRRRRDRVVRHRGAPRSPFRRHLPPPGRRRRARRSSGWPSAARWSPTRSPPPHRLAELFGHGVTFVDESAPPGSPVAAVSMGDIPLLLYPIPIHRRERTAVGLDATTGRRRATSASGARPRHSTRCAGGGRRADPPRRRRPPRDRPSGHRRRHARDRGLTAARWMRRLTSSTCHGSRRATGRPSRGRCRPCGMLRRTRS